MKKTLLFSLMFFCIELYAMGEVLNRKPSLDEMKEDIKVESAHDIDKNIRREATARILQERVRRIPGYEDFNILTQISTDPDDQSAETGARLNIESLFDNYISKEYEELKTDPEIMQMMRSASIIAMRNIKLKMIILQMEEIIDYDGLLTELEQAKADLKNRWNCEII